VNILIGAAAWIIVGAFSCLFTKRLINIIGIATASFIIGFTLSNALLAEKYAIWAEQTKVNKIPIMPMIQKYHPKNYALLMNQVAQDVKSHKNSGKILQNSYNSTNALYLSDLKRASDEAIYAYLGALMRGYSFLYNKDPNLVYKMENPDIYAIFEIQSLKTEPGFIEIYDAVASAKRNVIESSYVNPAPLPNQALAAPMLDEIMNRLRLKYGARTVNSVFSQAADTISLKVKSDVILDFYRNLLNMKKSDVGIIMRYIATQSEQTPKPQNS
jgi:hypothetical protein